MISSYSFLTLMSLFLRTFTRLIELHHFNSTYNHPIDFYFSMTANLRGHIITSRPSLAVKTHVKLDQTISPIYTTHVKGFKYAFPAEPDPDLRLSFVSFHECRSRICSCSIMCDVYEEDYGKWSFRSTRVRRWVHGQGSK